MYKLYVTNYSDEGLCCIRIVVPSSIYRHSNYALKFGYFYAISSSYEKIHSYEHKKKPMPFMLWFVLN